uniref:Uncharacterized protein n=1 Tax=Arundo donax TaxID=35708 RepID=A0A0A9H0C2_ARUDO
MSSPSPSSPALTVASRSSRARHLCTCSSSTRAPSSILRLSPWRRETREVRWSTAAALLSTGVEEAEERTAAISFSARRWLERTVDRRASRGTRTSWCSSRTDSAARDCRPAAADGTGDGGGAGDGVSMAISIAASFPLFWV